MALFQALWTFCPSNVKTPSLLLGIACLSSGAILREIERAVLLVLVAVVEHCFYMTYMVMVQHCPQRRPNHTTTMQCG
jgi:hypothetical protein